MPLNEFYNYILENYAISGEAARMLNNILQHAEHYAGSSRDSLYWFLKDMLDGAIGLTDEELKRVVKS